MNPYSVEKLPSDILIEIAEKHRMIRKSLHISQKELAEKSGVSLGSLKRFERTGKISFESLLRLAHVIGHLKDFEEVFVSKVDLPQMEKLISDKTR